jgi:RNase P subunit RPR2
MFNGTRMLKATEESLDSRTRTPHAATDDAWAGFVCKECGAPLAVHRSTATSKMPERSTRGWRVTCTGCGVTDYYELGTPMVRITVDTAGPR